jgi:hypothetical protein
VSRAAAAALCALLAAPASAQRLKGFEGQFLKGASDAGAKVLEKTLEATARLAEASAETGSSAPAQLAGDVLLLPFYPFGVATSMDRRPRGEHRLRAFGQHVDDRVRGWGGDYRYSAANHLHYEASWTAFLEEGALYDLHLVGARVLGDLHAEPALRVEYGLGVAGLAGRRHRGGPEFSLGGELAPRRLVFLDAKAAAVILEGGTLGDFRAGAGLRWRHAELRAGYRALVGPFDTLGGPELGFSLKL